MVFILFKASTEFIVFYISSGLSLLIFRQNTHTHLSKWSQKKLCSITTKSWKVRYKVNFWGWIFNGAVRAPSVSVEAVNTGRSVERVQTELPKRTQTQRSFSRLPMKYSTSQTESAPVTSQCKSANSQKLNREYPTIRSFILKRRLFIDMN